MGIKGLLHSNARADSGMRKLMEFAREKDRLWSVLEAAEKCEISERRCRAMVAALHEEGVLRCGMSWILTPDGVQPAEWKLTAFGRRLKSTPILIVRAGVIVGVRIAAQ